MQPTTLAEARRYRYGRWAGNDVGMAYREGYCIAEFVPNERGALPRQCDRQPLRGRPFCATHAPDKQAERDQRWRERYDARQAEEQAIQAEALRLARALGVEGAAEWRAFAKPTDVKYTRRLVIAFEDAERLIARLTTAPSTVGLTGSDAVARDPQGDSGPVTEA